MLQINPESMMNKGFQVNARCNGAGLRQQTYYIEYALVAIKNFNTGCKHI
jgi:hypothetical protein